MNDAKKNPVSHGRLAMLLLAAIGIGCTALHADTIVTNANCKVAVVAYMNGKLQISMTGSTALTLTSCDIGLKPHGASNDAWSEAVTKTSAKLGPGGTDNGTGVYFSHAVSLNSNFDVRFQASNGTDYTDWITWEDVRVEPYPLTVSAYSKSASYNPGGGLSCLENGKQDAIVELTSAKNEYLQLDYGHSCRISGIRVIPRLAFSDRVQYAKIEVSENADMSDATTAIASTAVPYNPATGGAVDWAFPEAVQGRYARVTAVGSDKVVDFCELEAYSDRPDASAFSAAVAQSAYDSACPRITMSMPTTGVESWTIERGFSSAGPWAVVATGNASQTEYVDESPSTVGATYWYRVRFIARTKAGESREYIPLAVSYLYSRCLERNWATAPGTLYTGVSVLADCQNTDAVHPTTKAFDGVMVDNFVVTTANPLMGLDFGKACHLVRAMALSRSSGWGIVTPVSLWGANVLPVNTEGAQASDDPNYTELFRNTEPGGNVLGHWYEFPVADPATASYRYAFLHKNAAAAASSGWGNVAEVTFYGYDDADAAAAQLIAPEQLTATRAADGIALAWTPGFNVAGYVLERKIGPDGEWSELGSFGLDAFGTKDTTVTVAGAVYSYRVKVTVDAVTKYSPEAAVCFYEAGDGTGLLATYSAPAPFASYNPEQAVLGSETTAVVNVSKAAGEAIFGQVVDNVLVAWKGKLIVPVAGEYAFAAEATDGFMLELDGDVKIEQGNLAQGAWDTSICSVLNDWTSTAGAVTTRTRSGYALTAGEHQIRAWWNPSSGAKSCVLKWTLPGAPDGEVIPASQLKPAATPDPETYGREGWRFGTVSNKRGYIAKQGDNAFTISEADVNPVSTFQHGAFAWKKVSSRTFAFEADVFAPQMFTEYGGLFVSANLNGGMRGDGASLFLYRLARNAGVNVRCRTGSGASDANLLGSDYLVSSQNPGTVYNDTEYTWLRIERNGNTFTMKARRGSITSGSAQGEWTTIATHVDTEGRFGDEVFIGFGSTTASLSERVYQARYLFTDVRFKERKGMVISFR